MIIYFLESFTFIYSQRAHTGHMGTWADTGHIPEHMGTCAVTWHIPGHMGTCADTGMAHTGHMGTYVDTGHTPGT